MAVVLTDNKHYKAIAEAIRANAHTNQTYTPEEMPQGIYNAHDAGYLEGWGDGTQNGIQSEYDRFWDEYQNKGGPKNNRCAFNGYGWTADNFYPKYDIKGDSNTGHQTFMFFNAHNYGLQPKLDLAQRLRDCGVVYDSSSSVYFENTFYCAFVSVVPEVSTLKCTGTLSQTFYGPHIETIEKLILRDDGVQSFNKTFNEATALKNIVIEGTIGKNGFNVSWSPLTHNSLMSIINALQDKTDTGTTWTVTLGTVNLAKLTDAEKAIATQKGWTLA